MASPDKTRPVRIVVIFNAGFFRLVESLHDAPRQPGVLRQHWVLESDHVHDRIISVLPEILHLFSLGIGKQPADIATASSFDIYQSSLRQGTPYSACKSPFASTDSVV